MMPEIRDYFTEVEGMDFVALHKRREEILSLAPKNDDGSARFTELSDDHLSELAAIQRGLRKKIATSNGGRKASGPKGPKAPASLDDVL